MKNPLLRFKPGVLMKLSPVSRNRRVREVQQRSLKRANRTFDTDRFVDKAAIESARPSAKEPYVTGLFAAPVMTKWATHKIRRAENPIRTVAWRLERLLNLSRERVGDDLIGIDAQNPCLRRLLNAKVLLRTVTSPLASNHSSAEPASNLGGPVVTHGVDQEAFGSPMYAR
jgi:hypothetical protein